MKPLSITGSEPSVSCLRSSVLSAWPLPPSSRFLSPMTTELPASYLQPFAEDLNRLSCIPTQSPVALSLKLMQRLTRANPSSFVDANAAAKISNFHPIRPFLLPQTKAYTGLLTRDSSRRSELDNSRREIEGYCQFEIFSYVSAVRNLPRFYPADASIHSA
jgi:hypothetical protein